MALSPDSANGSTPGPAHPRLDRSLSVALDRATIQAEAAEHAGDAGTARAWRRVLRDLEQRIPESRP